MRNQDIQTPNPRIETTKIESLHRSSQGAIASREASTSLIQPLVAHSKASPLPGQR